MQKLHFYFLLSALIFSPNVFSADDQFCKSTEGLEKVKTYLMCQAEPSITSCAGVFVGAGAVAGLSKAELRQQIKLNQFLKLKPQLVVDIASKLHMDWASARDQIYDPRNQARAMLKDIYTIDTQTAAAVAKWHNATSSHGPGVDWVKNLETANRDLEKSLSKISKTLPADRKKKLIELQAERNALLAAEDRYLKTKIIPRKVRLKEIDGKFYDIANMDYKDLPEKFQFENEVSAEIAVEQIEKKIKSGKAIDAKFIDEASDIIHQEWLKRNGSWATEEQKKPFSQLSKVEADKNRIIAQRAIDTFQEADKKVSSSAFEKSMLRAAKLGKKSILIMGGILSAGLTAAAQLASNPNITKKELATGVAAELVFSSTSACAEVNDRFMNLDENCKPIAKVDINVYTFLKESESVQLEALKNKKVCDFYKNLNSNLEDTSNISIESMSCAKDKIKITSLSKGSEMTYWMNLNKNGEITRINSFTGASQKNVYNFEKEDIDPNNIIEESMAKEITELKKVIGDVKSCCSNQTDECTKYLLSASSSKKSDSTQNNSASSAQPKNKINSSK